MTTSWSRTRELLLRASRLREVTRAGWTRVGIERPESVAEHTFGVALAALVLAPPELDREKLLAMAILHDLAEVEVGDITPYDGVPKDEKKRRELEAMRTMLVDHPELLALFEEAEEGTSEEARFLHALDKLDMDVMAERYAAEGHDTREFRESARASVEAIEKRVTPEALSRRFGVSSPAADDASVRARRAGGRASVGSGAIDVAGRGGSAEHDASGVALDVAARRVLARHVSVDADVDLAVGAVEAHRGRLEPALSSQSDVPEHAIVLPGPALPLHWAVSWQVMWTASVVVVLHIESEVQVSPHEPPVQATLQLPPAPHVHALALPHVQVVPVQAAVPAELLHPERAGIASARRRKPYERRIHTSEFERPCDRARRRMSRRYGAR